MVLEVTPGESTTEIVRTVIVEFLDGVIGAIPRALSGIVFLILAYLAIKLILAVARRVIDALYPADQRLIVDLAVAIIGVFLWFAAALALLKIVGLGEVAASLGTAAGFIGLGVAFALKEMIADTVAGVYLLRDPNFNEGDRVDAASVKGEVTKIDLRKTRIRAEDGTLVVVANRDVEKKWTNHSEATAA